MSSDHQRGVGAAALAIAKLSLMTFDELEYAVAMLTVEERETLRRVLSAETMTIETELPAVKVKALEWEYVERPLMTYTAFWEDGDVAYYINQAFGSDSYYFSTIRWPEETIYDGDDLPSAKAAAQADYERRILSALTLKDDPGNGGDGEAEPVAWRYRYKDGKWVVQKNKPHWYKDGMADVEIEPLFSLSQHRKGSEADGE